VPQQRIDVTLHYTVFALLIRSNLPIPELTPVPFSERNPDVNVLWQVSPKTSGTLAISGGELTYTSAYTDPSGAPALKIWLIPDANLLRLEYSDGARFWLDREGRNVWASWPDSLSIDDTATYFLGPVLGLVLRLRGITCLHASAIAFDGRAAAFVGSEGAGKSTTAAALARKGFVVLSDDIVALEERDQRFLVKPAYPYLCLWPESVTSLYGSPDALPRFAAGYEKRCLSLERQSLEFAAEPLPLACVYILGERGPDPAPLVEPVAKQEAMLTLLANTYATNMLDRAMRAREFETLGRLMQTVPVRRVRPHSDPSRIDDLCSLIVRDIKTIP
jgi:hypothetical protein